MGYNNVMPKQKRSIDIVQPKYHPSSKPEDGNAPLSKDDVMMLLEKSQRSQTTLPDGSTAPRPTGAAAPADRPDRPAAPARSGWRRLLTIVLGTIALAAAVFFGVQAGSRLFDAWADLTPVDSSTNEANEPSQSTDNNTSNEAVATNTNTNAATTNTTTNTPATNATATNTTAATNTSTTTTKLSVKVLNGNGVAGDANKVKAILEAAGITVAATGNAKTFGYATTIVYYTTGKKDAADRVAAALTGYSVSTVENAVANGYDALVVVGAK